MSNYRKNYWVECVEIGAEDCGLKLTKEQAECIASAVEGAHENYGMAFGDDVASANWSAERKREVDDLKEKLSLEKRKVQCKSCNGTGNITTYGGTFQSTSSCYKCNGEGRHL